MSKKEHIVKLTKAEQPRLNELLSKGRSPAKQQLKARILLKADTAKGGSGWSDGRIAEALGTYPDMVYRVRRMFAEKGLATVFVRKQRETPPVARIFDGEKEARLIALSCSEPPLGQASGSLRLLANKAVELRIVDHVSHSTVGLALKKPNSSRILKNNGSFRRKPTLRS
jgi:hypothetical protein